MLGHTFQNLQVKPTKPGTTQETKPMYKSEGKKSKLVTREKKTKTRGEVENEARKTVRM